MNPYEQINESELIEPMDTVATLAVGPEQIRGGDGIHWLEFDLDGIGRLVGVPLRLADGRVFSLVRDPSMTRQDIMINAPLTNVGEMVDAVLCALGLTSRHLDWLCPEARFSAHSLFREDDNGARFHIADFPCRADAEARAEELAVCVHKQAYFVERTSPMECQASGTPQNVGDFLHKAVPA